MYVHEWLFSQVDLGLHISCVALVTIITRLQTKILHNSIVVTLILRSHVVCRSGCQRLLHTPHHGHGELSRAVFACEDIKLSAIDV